MMLSKLDHGPSRKQNVACDACRTKKIRCRRTTTAENVREEPERVRPKLTSVRAMLGKGRNVYEQLYRAAAGQGEEGQAGERDLCGVCFSIVVTDDCC
jgi:hypothetical protein